MENKNELKEMDIEDNNIIICENCYTENERTRKTCKNCGAKLYKNNVERQERTIKDEEEEVFEEESNYSGRNKVAVIIKVIAIITAIAGVIYGFTLFDSSYIEYIAIAYILASIIVGIFTYSVGEIVQLLEDIKNKW